MDEDELDKLAKESKQFVISLASDANLIPEFTSYENGFKAGANTIIQMYENLKNDKI